MLGTETLVVSQTRDGEYAVADPEERDKSAKGIEWTRCKSKYPSRENDVNESQISGPRQEQEQERYRAQKVCVVKTGVLGG